MKRIFFFCIALFLLTGCDARPEPDASQPAEKSKFAITAPDGFEQHLLPSGNGMVFTKTVDNHEEWIVPDKEGKKNPYSIEIGVFSDANILGYENLSELLNSRYVGYNYEFKGEDLSDGVFVNEMRKNLAVKHFFLLSGDEIIEAYLEVPGLYFQRHEKEFFQIVDQIKL